MSGHLVDRETLEHYRTALDSGMMHGPWTRATCAAILRTLDACASERDQAVRERDEAWFEERQGRDTAGNEITFVWCRRCGVNHQRPEHCSARGRTDKRADRLAVALEQIEANPHLPAVVRKLARDALAAEQETPE